MSSERSNKRNNSVLVPLVIILFLLIVLIFPSSIKEVIAFTFIGGPIILVFYLILTIPRPNPVPIIRHQTIPRNRLGILEQNYSGKDLTENYSSQMIERPPHFNCRICFSDNLYDIAIYCPFCGTTFHKKHLEIWFLEQSFCPLCRNNLKKILNDSLFTEKAFSLSSIKSL